MGAALVSPTILQDAKNTPAHSVSPWYPGRRIGRQGTLSRNGRPAFQYSSAFCSIVFSLHANPCPGSRRV